jgi:hypothetical protein
MRCHDGVGVMEDKELNLEDIETHHTLGGTSYILLRSSLGCISLGLFRYIDLTKESIDISKETQ